MNTRLRGPLVLIAALGVLGACDPQKLVNDYFKSLGLNPLAVVRDDVKPGALIIKAGGNAVYADSIYSYGKAQDPQPTVENLDQNKDFQALLKAHESDRSVDASAALDFLKTVLPINISVDLGLTNKVKIDAIHAKGHRLAVPAVLDYLRNHGTPLHDFIATQGAGAEAYVAYETYEADTLNIVAESGSDVSTKLETSQEFKQLASGKADFKYARTRKDTLVIKGDHPFVFAVRTGKLVYQNKAYKLQLTNFASGQVKAVGGDEKYAAPVNQDFMPLKIERKQ